MDKSLDELVEQIAKDTTGAITAAPLLDAAKAHLQTDKPDMKAVIKILNTSIIKKYVNYLLRIALDDGAIVEYDFHNLETLIYVLQTVYNYDPSGELPVSDYTYDRLYELLERCGEEMVTTPVVDPSRIVNHVYKSLRGTLKKVYSLDETDEVQGSRKRRSLDDWIQECQRIYKNETGKEIDLNNEEVYVFPKWDGVSVVFEFDENNRLKRALTRGHVETNEATDVTALFSTMQLKIRDESMTGVEYGLKTEVMVSEKDKNSYNRKYGTTYHSARSIASSIVNTIAKDGRENLLEVVKLRTSTLDMDGNETLQELASDVYNRPFLRCQLSQRDAIRKFGDKNRMIRGLNTDGVVIYIIDENIRKILGRKDHKNQYEIAYKYSEEIGYTKVEDIEFNVTTFGKIFPVARVKQIQMKGNDVSHVSLGSIALMKDLALRKGDTVKIRYEIIPYLEMDSNDPQCKRSKNPIIRCPEKCPECGDPVEFNATETILSCINPVCPARMRGRILNFVSKVGIRNVGESTVKSLMDAGLIKWIPDIYTLPDHRNLMTAITGFDTISVDNIISEIESHKTLPAVTFLSAIGIESLGKKTAEKLLSAYAIDELVKFAEEGKVSKLTILPDIGDTLAKSILDGIWENSTLISQLSKSLVDIIYEAKKDAKFVVVFHNIRSRKLTMDIEALGGVVEDGLTKRTSFLIVPNGFAEETTSTTEKARRYGIPIVEVDNVTDYLEKYK